MAPVAVLVSVTFVKTSARCCKSSILTALCERYLWKGFRGPSVTLPPHLMVSPWADWFICVLKTLHQKSSPTLLPWSEFLKPINAPYKYLCKSRGFCACSMMSADLTYCAIILYTPTVPIDGHFNHVDY